MRAVCRMSAKTKRVLRRVAKMIGEGDTISEIAEELSVSRNTVREWIRVHPELARAAREAEEGQAVLVKMDLYDRAMSGDTWAMIRYLKHAREM